MEKGIELQVQGESQVGQAKTTTLQQLADIAKQASYPEKCQ